MAASNTPAKSNGNTGLARKEAVTAAFVQLVNQVPDAPEGDITDLLGPILAAASWEELNTLDNLPSSKTMVGHEVRIDTAAKKVSEKDTMTGYYLLCEGVDFESGYKGRFTLGGEQAVAVVSKLYVLRALPAKVKFVEVPVTSGNTAINCQVLETYPNRTVDA